MTDRNNKKRSFSCSNSDQDHKRKGPKWNYQCCASWGNDSRKNGKVYHWCTGPCQGGIGIWVCPHTWRVQPCFTQEQCQAQWRHQTQWWHRPQSQASTNKHLQEEGNLFERKVEAMLSVMDSWQRCMWNQFKHSTGSFGKLVGCSFVVWLASLAEKEVLRAFVEIDRYFPHVPEFIPTKNVCMSIHIEQQKR